MDIIQLKTSIFFHDVINNTTVALEFYLLHVVQTGSGVHSTSYPMGTGGKATEA
jgi:hypothetical protein